MSNDASFTVVVGFRDETPWDESANDEVQQVLRGEPINGYYGVEIDQLGVGVDRKDQVLILKGSSKRLHILDTVRDLRSRHPEFDVSCFGWIDGQGDLFWDDPVVGSGTAAMIMSVGRRWVAAAVWSQAEPGADHAAEAVVPLG